MSDETIVGGLSIPQRSDDSLILLQDARKDGYDFITTNLPHSSNLFRRDVTLIESKFWSTSIVGNVASPSSYKSEMDTDTSEKSAWNFGQDIITVLASNDAKASSQAEQHLMYMLDWSAHMNIPAVILPPITASMDKRELDCYGRFVANNALKASANNLQLWVRVSFHPKAIENFHKFHRMCDGALNVGCMLMMDLEAVTYVTEASLSQSMDLMHYFIGSNLRAISFHTDVFLSNKKGFPTLPKSIQFLFVEMLKRLGRTCRVLVEGVPLHYLDNETDVPQGHDFDEQQSSPLGHSGLLLYIQYLRHLRSKDEVKNIIDTEEAKMETGYLDHLQSALQPLGDNLEFSTYEVFEKDPVKYARYQDAVEYAIRDKIQLGQLRTEPTSMDKNNISIHVTIFVVGAGRGPLVNASIRAIKTINTKHTSILGNNSKIQIDPRIVAVEKNPSAVLYLNSLKRFNPDWKVVDVVQCDMREAMKNQFLSNIILGDEADKVDIVVSELLGSFGDNELSPECLDGFQLSGLLKENGVSIPQNYTSYLAPVTSMRLHAESHAHAFFPSEPTQGPGGKPCGVLQAMETPYVVRTHAATQLHEELPCWTFTHPLQKEGLPLQDAAQNVENERYAEVIFDLGKDGKAAFGSGYQKVNERLTLLAKSDIGKGLNENFSNQSYTIHGYLGSFHCLLYQSVLDQTLSSVISIAPSSFSVGMFSWFPLYFPLREPQIAPKGSSAKCIIYRKCDENRVWYEWCSEIIVNNTSINTSPLHNPNGRSCVVRL